MIERDAPRPVPLPARGEPAFLDSLRATTPARIGLGRAGVGLPTAAHLDFQLAHARARDAVHAALDVEGIAAALPAETLRLRSLAADRAAYLRRPDLGRRLDAPSRALLEGRSCATAFVVADGLSATAVNRHAASLIRAMGPAAGPVSIVEGGRVAIGDEIGGLLGADLVAVLIGERPGLSAADSLGVYVTWQPAPGAVDAARNCLSNIRPEGMPVAEAAAGLAALFAAARRHRMTGVGLSRRLAVEGK
ncbi:MAG TPA: ethanolamine ammonia-lyase subunit EutC [Stellaceae bacterium]|nr:ethanolamine ammonia-lyase subunit EutC [Stellaceae bacterium]